MVLDLVQDIERRHYAVALAGIYIATSTHNRSLDRVLFQANGQAKDFVCAGQD
jgi:hypothetical protein